MLKIDQFLHYRELEDILSEELQKYELIGELPIDRENFKNLFTVMKRAAPIESYEARGKWKITNVPKTVFATSMVFGARYSDENVRNFWTPYAQFWGLNEPDQRFQSQCRDYFREVRSWLKETYDFYFPSLDLDDWHDGHVVRDIYTHAIIPFYLQDDFARWFNHQNVYRYKRMSMTEVVDELLHNDELFKYISPNLKHFMQGSATVELAASLIKTLAEAYQLNVEGLPNDEISKMLKNVEKDIWDQLNVEVAQKASMRSHKINDISIKWLWSIDDDELQILISEFSIANDMPPHCWSFVNSDNSLSHSINFTFLDPWEIGDGYWLIEETFIKNIPDTSGKLVLSDEHGKLIRQITIDELEIEPINIFQLTRQNAFGLPIKRQNAYLSDGEWLISMLPDVEVRSETNNEPIVTQMSLTVPQKLYDKGHRIAGIYNLKLPVQFVTPQTSFLIESLMSQSAQITLSGDLYDGLSRRVPPVYRNNQIELHINNINLRLKQNYRLWITDTHGHVHRYGFEELVKKNILEEEQSAVIIKLRLLLLNAPGVYHLEIRKNLQIIHDEVISLSILPNVEIQGPDLQQVYTPTNLPVVRLLGIKPENIKTSTADLIKKHNTVDVQWNNLRDDCRLAIQIDDIRIPLAWDIERFYGWISPENENDFFTMENLYDSRIHIRGPRNAEFKLRVNHGAWRDYHLNKAGEYNNELRQDQLLEMIRADNETSAIVEIEFAGEIWELLRILRHPEINHITAFYDPNSQELDVEISANYDWSGNFTLYIEPVAGLAESNEIYRLEFTEFVSGQSLTFSYEIATGLYNLSLFLDDLRVPLNQPIQLEVIDQIWQDADLELEDASFNRRSTQTIRVHGHSKTRLMQLSQNSYLSEGEIYEILTMPAKDYIKLRSNTGQFIWELVENLRQVELNRRSIINAKTGLHEVPLNIIQGHIPSNYQDTVPASLPSLEEYTYALDEWQTYITSKKSIFRKLHYLFVENYEVVTQTVSTHQFPLARAVTCLCINETPSNLVERYPIETLLVACQLRSIASGFRQRYLSQKSTSVLLSLAYQHTPHMLNWFLTWADTLLLITRQSNFNNRK